MTTLDSERWRGEIEQRVREAHRRLDVLNGDLRSIKETLTGIHTALTFMSTQLASLQAARAEFDPIVTAMQRADEAAALISDMEATSAIRRHRRRTILVAAIAAVVPAANILLTVFHLY